MKAMFNYFGSKNGSGVVQQIINQIRPHDVFMELFGGSLAVTRAKKIANWDTIANDADPSIVNRWNNDEYLPATWRYNCDAVRFLQEYDFSSEFKYCIYLDPPYPLGSRKSDRLVYRHEMTDAQHVDLLLTVIDITERFPNVDFLISTYKNDLYSKMLAGWQLHTFQAQTRRGLATEYLYMNYDNPEGVLHQYDYLGDDYIDRQRIKRKVDGKVAQLRKLPAKERQAIISALAQLA